MFRTYLTYWDRLSLPIDARVTQAVRNSMNDPQIKADRTQHHHQFLDRVAESKGLKWGKSTDGVSARLRAERTVWPTNLAVKLRADIRNLGKRSVTFIQSATAHELEVDGQRYRFKTGGGKSSLLNPSS